MNSDDFFASERIEITYYYGIEFRKQIFGNVCI